MSTFKGRLKSCLNVQSSENQQGSKVEVASFERSSFCIEPLIFYFFDLKRTCSLNHKKRFQQLKPKYVAYQIQWGPRCKELIAENPFKSISDNFPTFPAGNRFYDMQRQQASHYLLIAEIGVPLLICFNRSGRLIPAIETIAASLFTQPAGWLTAISYLLRMPH